MKDQSLVDIYLKMFTVLKPTMNFQQCCDTLGIENRWGGDQFTAIKAIELFITFANQQVTGKTTYVFGGQKWADKVKRTKHPEIKKKEKKCRKTSLAHN